LEEAAERVPTASTQLFASCTTCRIGQLVIELIVVGAAEAALAVAAVPREEVHLNDDNDDDDGLRRRRDNLLALLCLTTGPLPSIKRTTRASEISLLMPFTIPAWRLADPGGWMAVALDHSHSDVTTTAAAATAVAATKPTQTPRLRPAMTLSRGAIVCCARNKGRRRTRPIISKCARTAGWQQTGPKGLAAGRPADANVVCRFHQTV
jgi:hypothetical protein